MWTLNAAMDERGELTSWALLTRSVDVVLPEYKSDLVDRSASFLMGYQTWT